MTTIRVPVLIVGAGGCGLTSSIALSELGVKSLLVERHPTTGRLPKARYVNQRTMEVFRQIGVAVLNYVGENNNTFPVIEPNEQNPLYDPEKEAKPLLEALEPYGLSTNVLKCPADQKYIHSHGTSYQWRPFVDEENALAPKIYGRRGGAGWVIRPGRATICTDYTGVHFGRMNRLYADGHVKAQLVAP